MHAYFKNNSHNFHFFILIYFTFSALSAGKYLWCVACGKFAQKVLIFARALRWPQTRNVQLAWRRPLLHKFICKCLCLKILVKLYAYMPHATCHMQIMTFMAAQTNCSHQFIHLCKQYTLCAHVRVYTHTHTHIPWSGC